MPWPRASHRPQVLEVSTHKRVISPRGGRPQLCEVVHPLKQFAAWRGQIEYRDAPAKRNQLVELVHSGFRRAPGRLVGWSPIAMGDPQYPRDRRLDGRAERLVTVPEAADLLAVSASTVRRLIGRRLIASVRVGRAVRLPLSAVLEVARLGTSERVGKGNAPGGRQQALLPSARRDGPT